MKIKSERQKAKITIIAILLAGSCFLTYYFHVVLQSGTVFTHFFYIPVILASLWWKRKGLAVAIFLAVFLIFSNHFLRDYVVTANDYLRALMFIAIGLVVTTLNERTARAQEKTAHLNAVLRAIQNVNLLIAKEKDHDRLLKGICDNLIEFRGYYSGWIALFDESGGLVTTAESGFGKDFLSMIDYLKRGELPACAQKALPQSDVVVTEDMLTACADCSIARMYGGRGAMTIRLEYDGKVYGLISASIPIDFATDEEQQTLFKDIARDIGFALYSIELEQERKRVEEELKEHHEHLEELVAERTAELSKVNEQLKQNISERKLVEEVLREKEKKLENQAQHLEKVNSALSVLLEHREEEKKKLEENILTNVKKLILPYIERIHKGSLDGDNKKYLSIIKSDLKNLISPFANKLSSKYFDLTPTEIQIADLIKLGKSSKEIASLLNVSSNAISFHRGNIRNKLGLLNKKINLGSYLQSLSR